VVRVRRGGRVGRLFCDLVGEAASGALLNGVVRHGV
jgi:hypothetical protein